MKTSIATVCLSGDFREKLEAIAAAGFDGIEIFEQDFLTSADSPRAIGRMVRDHGLDITLFQPFRDFEGLPEPLRARAFARAERKFELMNQLGTDLVLVCSSVHPEALGGIDRMAEDFRALGDLAARHGVRVGFEALAWGRHVNDHRDVWEVVRRADHPNVGVILDSFHTLARKIDPDTIRRIPGDRIFFVQLADAPAIPMDLLYWSRHFRNMPGEGDLDVLGFMRAVQAAGYAGPLSLEVFNDQFRGGNARLIARDGYRSLVNLMDRVRRAEPALTVDLPPFPPPQPTTGVAYVEFAARGDEARFLESQLAAMGFRRAATHRRKAVTVWQQGDIRLLVNAEEVGYAAASFATHGLGACEIGLAVADARDAAARADHLGAEPFEAEVAEGEMRVPAYRGVGGTVLRFLDRGPELGKIWDTEFTPEGGANGRGAGLTRVDHVAQTMRYDEMLSWSLFYASLFGLEKSPMVDVIDPHGLVRSLAMESEDGNLRLTFNGAETHRTFAGSFLAESFGSSVQHIALSCDDIFATAAALAENGFAPLPMSSNYYEDLDARFDLSGGLLERLQAHSILYDRDGEGEFFQLYSLPHASGIFFEIVCRRGGYAGYGAPNAPFRIAAQKRLTRVSGMPRL